MEQASALFNPSPKEASTDTTENPPEPEPKTSTQIAVDNQVDTGGGPFDAVVVDANFDLPPVRSNVDLEQPLRPKPPSDGVFSVTPGPNLGQQYGVQNPNFYSNQLKSKDNYGPDDFMVETVKLDKAFFHQFFTSKPLLLGTEVVTSKSVEVDKNYAFARKRSRKTSADLPDSLIENLPQFQDSKLQQMAKNHLKSTTTTTTTTTTVKPETTTTTTARPETEKRTTAYVPNTSKKISDVPKIINSVKTFTRYYIPPEVKISHSVGTTK